MTKLPAETVARALRNIAAGLRLQRESKFRIAAYERAAQAVEAFKGDLTKMIRDGRLRELPGVGERLAPLIEEIHTTGSAKLLDALSRDLPVGALELARGPKLSRKAIATLSHAGIRDLNALAEAARTGRLRELPGFSEKTEARITREMADAEARRGQMVLSHALMLVAHLAKFMRAELDVVGEVRRGLEVVRAIDVLLVTDDPASALKRFGTWRRLVSGHTAEGVAVRLHCAPPHARAAMMQRLTGSDTHNADFDRAAARAGFALDPHGSYESEEEIYALARLAWVPPPLREGEGEVAAAANGGVPRLVQPGDVLGAVHCHSDFSDGKDSIETMARAAQERGLKYITITDHSPSAFYANGVTIDRLYRQWEEIARVQEKLSIRILRGTESDILKDGSLDYPDSVLEQLDVIIASIHNRYRLDSTATTARIVEALRHPLFKIWGHALGRILLHRPPVECDVEAILDVAAESRVAIELNGDPYRMDMEPRWAKLAHARGIPFVISVDAHSTRNFDSLRYGITLAQRAGLQAKDVINTADAREFTARVRPNSPRAIRDLT